MKRKLLLCSLLFLAHLSLQSQTINDYNLLFVYGDAVENNKVQSMLEGLGHTVTVEVASNLDSNYDYSSYDAILFGRNSSIPDMTNILNLNTNNQLGIVLFRSINSVVQSIDVGSQALFNGSDFVIENNSHYITQPFSTGVLNLGFTFKSRLISISPNCSILGSVNSGEGSLVVHNTYRRVLSADYGWGGSLTRTTDALTLLDRIIAWASDKTTLSTNDVKPIETVKIHPNPTTNQIKLSHITTKGSYKIYNTLGTEVLRGVITRNNTTINVKQFSNGLYFLKLNNGNTLKFIKE